MRRTRRTNRDSLAFKEKIADLKRQGRSGVEIAEQLGVTRQYVSLVLNQAGLTSGRRRCGPVKSKRSETDPAAMIARLEQQGLRGQVEKLRTILDRKTKVKKRPGERE